MKHTPTVSILFPICNGGNQPLECLESIAKLSYLQKNIEVIVIDNHSTDKSASNIFKRFPGTIIIKNKSNVGFPRAINQGLSCAHGEYLCISNDDVLFDTHSVSKVVQYMQKHSEVGVVSGLVYKKSRPEEFVAAGFFLNKVTGDIIYNKNTLSISEPDWIDGCSLFFSRTVFARIGFLDTGYPHYFEDFDFCMRARKAGFKIRTLPEVIIWHESSNTVNKNLPQKYANWYESKIRFVIKYLPLLNMFLILILQTFIIIPYRLIILRDGRLIPYIRACQKNFRNINKTILLRNNLKEMLIN